MRKPRTWGQFAVLLRTMDDRPVQTRAFAAIALAGVRAAIAHARTGSLRPSEPMCDVVGQVKHPRPGCAGCRLLVEEGQIRGPRLLTG